MAQDQTVQRERTSVGSNAHDLPSQEGDDGSGDDSLGEHFDKFNEFEVFSVFFQVKKAVRL